MLRWRCAWARVTSRESRHFDGTKSLTAEMDGAVTLHIRASELEPGAVFRDAVILQRVC